eukprot:1161168-Pelagomonas_calceolata.AAC.1
MKGSKSDIDAFIEGTLIPELATPPPKQVFLKCSLHWVPQPGTLKLGCKVYAVTGTRASVPDLDAPATSAAA